MIECEIPDAGDAVGDGEITASTWDSNQLSAILVEQHWSCRTVIWIAGRNHNTRQAAAARECSIPDAGDAVGNGDARQASAVTECGPPDAGEAVGDGEITASTWDSNQLSAILVEQHWSCRTVIWIAGRNHNTRQAAAARECVNPDAGDAVGNGDARQAAAVIECVNPDAGDAVGNSDARQAAAVIECGTPDDTGEAVGNGDARQASAVTECGTPDVGDAVGDGEITASTWDSNQLSAILVEQHWSCRTVIWIAGRNHNTRQAAAARECGTPDAGDAVGDGDARQAAAVPECGTPDAGDAVGDGDARQASAVTECVNPDAGDAAPVNNSWNLPRSNGTRRIVSNRHRYVVGIDHVGIRAKRSSTSVA